MWIIYFNGQRYGQNRDLLGVQRDLVMLANDFNRPDAPALSKIEILWEDPK